MTDAQEVRQARAKGVTGAEPEYGTSLCTVLGRQTKQCSCAQRRPGTQAQGNSNRLLLGATDSSDLSLLFPPNALTHQPHLPSSHRDPVHLGLLWNTSLPLPAAEHQKSPAQATPSSLTLTPSV